jgi:voltage-dependent calcium channel L type alpha-1D
MPLLTKWDCLNSGGIWQNRTFNFDNIVNALITLFTMSTTAGWSEMMIQTITAVKEDFIPDQQQRNPLWVIFFMVFMIVGFFFFLNLFVAVVINTFKTEQDRVGGYDLLTEKQKEWIDLKMLILRACHIF